MRKLIVSEFMSLDGVIQAPVERTRIGMAAVSTADGPGLLARRTSARLS
jgi:hypothetical protein